MLADSNTRSNNVSCGRRALKCVVCTGLNTYSAARTDETGLQGWEAGRGCKKIRLINRPV